MTFGEALLAPSVLYVELLRRLLGDGQVRLTYLSHITGHGLLKLMRPQRELTYRIRALPPVPPVLAFLAAQAELDAAAAHSTLNMGAGFAVYCRPGGGAHVVRSPAGWVSPRCSRAPSRGPAPGRPGARRRHLRRRSARTRPSSAPAESPSGGELSLHRLRQGKRRRQRPDHHDELVDQAILVGVQKVAPLDLAVADAGFEDERMVVRIGSADLADVAEVLEHERDCMQQGRGLPHAPGRA